MGRTSYLIGLGSNRRHGLYGDPVDILDAAIDAIEDEGLKLRGVSPILRTAAMGPAGRDFANAAILVRTKLDPPALLACLKAIERRFGRRNGLRWGPRVLDLDILAWKGGAWPTGPRRAMPGKLAIPHPGLTARSFALGPAATIAPHWRHPHNHGTLRQLEARLGKARPVDRDAPGQ